MPKHFFLTTLVIFMHFCCEGQTENFFISNDGSDLNNGSLNLPFLTLEKALKVTESLNSGEVIIYLRKGIYELKNSVYIDSIITRNKNLTIKSYNNEDVLISGGIKLNKSKIKLCSDDNILKFIPPKVSGKVYEIDLKEQGVMGYTKYQKHGYGTYVTAPTELFYDTIPSTFARWPNSGGVLVGKVLSHGSILRNADVKNEGAVITYDFPNADKWTDIKHIRLNGVFNYGFADDNISIDTIDKINHTIKLSGATNYGVYSADDEHHSNGLKYRQYYASNVLEEIDSTGEMYFDEQNMKMYCLPPNNVNDFYISNLDAPLLFIKKAKNVHISGLNFAYGKTMGIYLEECSTVNIDHCSFYDLGTVAISLSEPLTMSYVMVNGKSMRLSKGYSNNITINHCKVYNTGTGGIILSGGDRNYLLPAHNIVENSEFYNYGRHNPAFSPAVKMGGVGNVITHCYIHDATGQAINFLGNDHQITWNHIKNVMHEYSDVGAVTTARDPSSTGSVVQYNFFDEIRSAHNYSVTAVYLDDGTCGIAVNNNVFYKCGSAGEYPFGAIHINGGSSNKFYNNYFIDCHQAFSNSVWDDTKWHESMFNESMLTKLTKVVDIRSSLYQSKYPFLINFLDSNSAYKRQNFVLNTFLFNVNVVAPVVTTLSFSNTYISKNGGEFDNYKNKLFGLRQVPRVFQHDATWQSLDFSKIGIEK